MARGRSAARESRALGRADARRGVRQERLGARRSASAAPYLEREEAAVLGLVRARDIGDAQAPLDVRRHRVAHVVIVFKIRNVPYVPETWWTATPRRHCGRDDLRLLSMARRAIRVSKYGQEAVLGYHQWADLGGPPRWPRSSRASGAAASCSPQRGQCLECASTCPGLARQLAHDSPRLELARCGMETSLQKGRGRRPSARHGGPARARAPAAPCDALGARRHAERGLASSSGSGSRSEISCRRPGSRGRAERPARSRRSGR